jgi:hypothetical protein
MASKLCVCIYIYIYIYNVVFKKKRFLTDLLCVHVQLDDKHLRDKQYNALLKVKWSLVDCYVMKRHSLRKNLHVRANVSCIWSFSQFDIFCYFYVSFFLLIYIYIFLFDNLNARWFSFNGRQNYWSWWSLYCCCFC